jgi:hypothetical protein
MRHHLTQEGLDRRPVLVLEVPMVLILGVVLVHDLRQLAVDRAGHDE